MFKLYLTAIACVFVFTGSGQNYNILGNASTLSGCNCFRITPDANDQGGAIFQTNTINLNNSFDYTFNVFLGCNGANGADGIVFVLTSNPNGLGAAGGGLGYSGGNQPFSLAVEFDTWQNGDAGDPGYDHIGIESGGNINHNVAAPVSALTSQANIDDCAQHVARIVWDVNTNTFSVYFDGVLRQSIVIPNIVGSYFGGNPIVNWGWSGATGGGTNDQQVCVLSNSNWTGGVNYQSCNLSVQFSDISTSNLGSVGSWAWTFGDGGTSSLQNPTHIYSGTGTYTVTLTITDISGCTNTYSHPITINPPITITPTLNPPPCNGGTNGSIATSVSGGFGAAAGYGGYMYTWSVNNSLSTLGGVGAGTYTVTVTDGVCSASGQYTLSEPTALTAVVNTTDASCGANNGTANLTISGGTPPYQGLSWAGVPGNPATNLAAGFYIADFQDANGCSAALQYTATIGSLPCGYNLSTSSTNVTCFGGNNGTATVTVTGGIAPITITWSNGGNGATITGLTAGNYTYNYSDGNSQTFTGTVTVGGPAGPMIASLTTVNTSCAGTNDGQAIASVISGGTGPYTYNWSAGTPNGATSSGLGAGAVSVTVTGSNTCTATATGTITGPPTLTLSITAVNDSCYQSGTGSATANPAGGSPPYTYYWSNISSAQTNLGLSAATYTVTVTDDNGCTITGTTTINQPAPFSHTLTSQNINCFGGNTGSITVTPSGGTGAYSYNWTPSGTGNNPSGLTAGQYNVTISDANNCQRLDSVTLTQPATALSVVASHTNVSCYGGSNGSITIIVGGGTPPYSYPALPTPVPAGTYTQGNLGPNTYSGTVTDANGCTFAISETVTEPLPQSLTVDSTDNICNGGTAGTATANFVNATGSVTYNWSNSQAGATINSLPAGTYSVTATDQNQCSFTGSTIVNEPAAPIMTVNTTPAACFGGNGSATAVPNGGTAPFNYVWSASSVNNATNSLPAGNYSITATDVNQCNQTATFTITEPTGMSITETHTNLDCFGDTDGDIQLTVTGGSGPNYTYNWNPNVSTSDLAGLLGAGTYNITVTDQNSCTATVAVTLTQPAQPLTINVQPTNISCFGVQDGTITITSSGGTPNYTYTWNPNVSSSNSATGLGPGNYNITVTDANGCSTVPIVTLSQPNQPLSVTLTHTDLLCNGDNTGTITSTVNGGTVPYTYTWNPNTVTGSSASGLPAGNYALTVTDDNGCTNTATDIITQPTQLTTTETHVDVLCYGEATGSAIVTPAGGTGANTFNWSNGGSSTNVISSLTAGPYTVTVSDANNCTAVQAITIAQPALLTITATATDVLCNGDANGTITATPGGGVSPYTFTATDGTNSYNSGTGAFSGLAAGSYSILIIDDNQCQQTTNAVVGEPAAISATAAIANAKCYGYTDGSVAFTTNGGGTSYTYTFSDGSTNANGVFTGLGADTYYVTITDNNNCSITDSVVVTQPDSVVVTVNPTPVEVKLGNELPISLSTNQFGNVTYTWTPAFGLTCYDCANPTFNGVYSQPYTVVVTTDSGCVGTSEFVVTVIPNYDVFIPNAFTPNGDGENDYWQVFGNMTGIKQFQLALFNRIGEKVFETNDINFLWNGEYKGVKVPSGVYVYHARFVWLNNHSDAGYTGSLTVIR